MDLSVAFMGTGGSVPTARRSTACVIVLRGGDRLMFDCGEGSQRQMQRSIGLVQLDEIYLTHLHADHYLGLPGLLKTYDLQDRDAPLRVFGPAGTRDLFTALRRIMGRTRYDVEVVEVAAGEPLGHEGYEIRPFPVEHRITASGWELTEETRPGRFDAEAAERLGVPEGPAWGALQRGEQVEGKDGTVGPDEVLGELRPSRKLVISGDTAPCTSTVEAARGAQLLIHDGSFAEEEAQRAAETAHSTAGQAAALAREAAVEMLALVHVSSRYNVNEVLDEARGEFENTVAPRDFDLIEIPYPDRGEPQLIPNGARDRREAPEADPAAPAKPSAEPAG
jgi:ribonuclease Z